MGQQDVYDVLKAHKDRWFTTRELATIIGCSLGNVQTACRKMRHKEAEWNRGYYRYNPEY